MRSGSRPGCSVQPSPFVGCATEAQHSGREGSGGGRAPIRASSCRSPSASSTTRSNFMRGVFSDGVDRLGSQAKTTDRAPAAVANASPCSTATTWPRPARKPSCGAPRDATRRGLRDHRRHLRVRPPGRRRHAALRPARPRQEAGGLREDHPQRGQFADRRGGVLGPRRRRGTVVQPRSAGLRRHRRLRRDAQWQVLDPPCAKAVDNLAAGRDAGQWGK